MIRFVTLRSCFDASEPADTDDMSASASGLLPNEEFGAQHCFGPKNCPKADVGHRTNIEVFPCRKAPIRGHKMNNGCSSPVAPPPGFVDPTAWVEPGKASPGKSSMRLIICNYFPMFSKAVHVACSALI